MLRRELWDAGLCRQGSTDVRVSDDMMCVFVAEICVSLTDSYYVEHLLSVPQQGHPEHP